MHDRELALTLLQTVKRHGATSAEVTFNRSKGFDVSVRCNEIDKLEYIQETGITITVYIGKECGTVHTSDTSPKAIKLAAEKACHIASFTEEDSCFGLAAPEILAYDYPDLDLFHPWNISAEQAIVLAKECEAKAFAYDKRIINSEGVSISSHQHYYLYANTNDFIGYYKSTSHNASCCLVAGDNDQMQRDEDFTIACDANDLSNLNNIAVNAAQKTICRLHTRSLTARKCPVIMHADAPAKALIGTLIHAITGTNIYRKKSFLANHLDKNIFPNFVNIEELPHLKKGLNSAPFDHEGVTTKQKYFIRDGILCNYVLNSYTARKLDMQTTGNAGGVSNIFVKDTNHNLQALLKLMNTGLLVTELLGQGTNLVTGDYSRGAFGFWVEKGEIQYPVEGITIAGNLRDMFMNIIAIGNDIDLRSKINTGSILIGEMSVAG